MHELSRQDARRIAVRAQLLDAPRPTDLLATVRHLTVVQNDPVTAVARSADLVAWSRLGSDYRIGDLEDLTVAGAIVELWQMLRPAEDMAQFRAEMAAWPGVGVLKEWQEDQRDWVAANDDCRQDILRILREEGALPADAFPDTTTVPWRSSGWNNDRNVRMLLECMVSRGEVATAGYEGRDRLWDLAERVYPETEDLPIEEADAVRRARRLRALGIARPKTALMPGEPNDVGDAGEPATVEGVKGPWRVDPAYLPGNVDGDFTGRTALLSPLDRLVMDRKRTTEIFEFDYQLEMFKPVAKRKWGYWALPILHGDRLVGKLDATADRKAGVLYVDAVHEDEPFSPDVADAVDTEIAALADWLGLDLSHAR